MLERVVIINGTVMTGTGSYNAGWTIEITNGVITYFGLPANYVIPAGARIIDAKGNTVMPGVVDAYVHGTEYTAPDYGAQPIRRAFLLDGVTTTCNSGHSLASAASFDDGPIFNNASIGRVYNSGPHITAPLSQAVPLDVFDRLYEVETEQQIANAIAQLKAAGADFISITVGPAVDPQNQQVLAPIFSADQASWIAHHAGLEGLRVRVTAVDESFVPRAISTGAEVITFTPAMHSIDDLIHPSNRNPYIFAHPGTDLPSEETLARARDTVFTIAANGIVVIPMITVMDERYPWMRPEGGNPIRPARSMYEEVVAYFVHLGGQVALGSGFQPGDTPGMPMQEILALQRSGMTASQVITAITYNSARACGAENEIGTITVGKKGDILVLDGNIFNDITALDRPTHVILDGKVALAKD